MNERVCIGYSDYYATGEGERVALVAMLDSSEDRMRAAFTKLHGEFMAKGFEFVRYYDAPPEIKNMVPPAFLSIASRLEEGVTGGLRFSGLIDINLS